PRAFAGMTEEEGDCKRKPACNPLVADLHRERYIAAAIGKGRVLEARGAEGGVGIVREAITLVRRAEETVGHLGLVLLGMKQGHGIGARRHIVEDAGGCAPA